MPRTALLEELRNISRTLSTGIPAQGKGKLAAESLLHHQGKERYEMGRQKELDALNRPFLERRGNLAQREIDRANEDVTIHRITGGDPYALGHALHFMDDLAKAYGGKYDKKTGKVALEDGSNLKVGVMDANPGPGQGAMYNHFSPKEAAQDMRDRIYMNNLSMKKIGEERGLRADDIETQKKLAISDGKAKYIINSPKAQIEINKKLIQLMSNFKSPGWEKGIVRAEKDIDRLHKEYIAGSMAAIKAVADATSAKDNRSSDIKLIDYYAENITGGDKGKAIKIFRTDKLMGEKLRVYAEELKAMQNSMEWMNLSAEEQADAIENLQIRLEIKPKPGTPAAPVGGRTELLTGEQNNDPWGIR